MLFKKSARAGQDEKDLGPQILLNIVPFFHTFGMHVLLCTILFDFQLVTLPNFEPNSFLGAIQVCVFNSIVSIPIIIHFQ